MIWEKRYVSKVGEQRNWFVMKIDEQSLSIIRRMAANRKRMQAWWGEVLDINIKEEKLKEEVKFSWMYWMGRWKSRSMRRRWRRQTILHLRSKSTCSTQTALHAGSTQPLLHQDPCLHHSMTSPASLIRHPWWHAFPGSTACHLLRRTTLHLLLHITIRSSSLLLRSHSKPPMSVLLFLQCFLYLTIPITPAPQRQPMNLFIHQVIPNPDHSFRYIPRIRLSRCAVLHLCRTG